AAFDVRYTYDARYRTITATNGAGETTAFSYDANNNLTSMTAPRGVNAGQNIDPSFTTTYRYDELNSLLSVDQTALGGGVTQYVYDANRNVIAQQDANGNLVTYAYDKLNRLTDTFQQLAPGQIGGDTTRVSPFGGNTSTALHWHYEYDGNNNPTVVVDAKGQRMDMTYDYLDRLQRTTYSLASDPNVDFQPLTVSYSYDDNGNLISNTEVKHVGGTSVSEISTRRYDHLDRMVSSTNYDNKTITYVYDVQGNRTSVTDPDSITTTY